MAESEGRIKRPGPGLALPRAERIVGLMSAPAQTQDAQNLDGLENLVTGQGGRSDSRAHANRAFSYTLRTPQELQELYRTNWLAGQVVDIPAFEMTRERRTFQIDDLDKIKAIKAEEDRLCSWEKAKECIQWSRVFGGGGLLLGLDGMGEVDTPLDVTRVKKGSLKFLHALDARTLFPQAGKDTHLVMDPTSSQFMQPEFYSIASSRMEFIHHTRIIRFPGLPLPWLEMQRTLWWGGSHLERLFDAIADAEQVIGGVADLINEAKVDVYGIKGLMHLLSTPEGEATVKKRIALADSLKSIYTAIIMDSEEEYEQKTNAIVQGMSSIIEQYLAIAAAASGIPVTRLLGTSADGLSATGEGDLRNFYDMIAALRDNYLAPRINELDEVLIRSATGEGPEDIEWEFGSLWQMDESQVAEIEGKRATRDQVYLNAGVVDEVVVAKQLKADGTYAAIDDDYIEELEGDLEDLENNPPLDPIIDPDKVDPKADPETDPKPPADE